MLLTNVKAPGPLVHQFYYPIIHCYWKRNVCLNIKMCKHANTSNFQLLEVVGRGRETQLHLDENYYWFKG